MTDRRGIILPALFTCLTLTIILLTACARDPGDCPTQRLVDLSGAASYSDDEQLPFRFPLDDLSGSQAHLMTYFQVSGLETPARREYHAAEDYEAPPGTPVYAMADGDVSFSGPMGGYGWLVIVDHPPANLYSLYGHLSPSRWQIEPGPVDKGALLGYLGDDDENGGSADQPLVPHLHLGIRAGQRADYSGMGEWRWQAGWITPCPSDLGWLQPSQIIAGQEIPPDGFSEPTGRFLARWGFELIFASAYLIGGVCMLIYAIRGDKPLLLIINPAILIIAGIIFYSKSWRTSMVLFAMATLLLAIGIYVFIRRSKTEPDTQP